MTYPASEQEQNYRDKNQLRELLLLFLKLGTTAFGGPAAHIAMMEEEVVRRRQWLSREHFLDLLGATHLIPGPNSTELAMHIGSLRCGWRGLLLAGLAFILPSMLIVMLCAAAYMNYGSQPAATHILYGVKPVILGVIVQALWGLGLSAVKNRRLAVIGITATALNFLGIDALWILLGTGLLIMALAGLPTKPVMPDGAGVWMGAGIVAEIWNHGVASLVINTATDMSLPRIFLFFLKVGSLLFGSGYVLIALLRTDLVEHFAWITEAQLLDAVAIGHITPGPVFTTATFIGYLLAGKTGAVVATVGIFLPGFVYVALSRNLVPKIRQSKWAGAFLDGVNVASVALMAAVTIQLAHASIVDTKTLALSIFSTFLLIRFSINSTYLILAGGLLGLLLH